jgi:hypothetical protein
VEDNIFGAYTRALSRASTRYVIVYASDYDGNRRIEGERVRHRKFTGWIAAQLPDWKLVKHLPNRCPHRGDPRKGSFSEFFIYDRA